MKKIGIQQQCQVHDVSICLSTKGHFKGWIFVDRQTDICNENVFVRNKQKNHWVLLKPESVSQATESSFWTPPDARV